MRVLVAMSGGVDSSVAAALLIEQGHEVVGATMKLWGGESDSGCCSIDDVVDARRVADRLGIEHHVFNFEDTFNDHVVQPYVDSHRVGQAPNPCVECNRHVKFGVFFDRAMRLGFDVVATGHHARIERAEDGSVRLCRGADFAKDQSYVLGVVTENELRRTLLPVGEMLKSDVRRIASELGLITATKPDSQDVCFIAKSAGGRRAFLSSRIDFHKASLVDGASGASLGAVDAVELVTVGQRRGLGVEGARRYAVSVDVSSRRVVIGDASELAVDGITLRERTWVREALKPGTPVLVQVSAHGEVRNAHLTSTGITFDVPERVVSPGQLVVCYDADAVVGSGIAC